MNHELYGIVVTKVCVRATVFVYAFLRGEGGAKVPIGRSTCSILSWHRRGAALAGRRAHMGWAPPRVGGARGAGGGSQISSIVITLPLTRDGAPPFSPARARVGAVYERKS